MPIVGASPGAEVWAWFNSNEQQKYVFYNEEYHLHDYSLVLHLVGHHLHMN
jgi:hypothetical protein